MIIQINTDKNIPAKESRDIAFEKRINDSFEHFSKHITRVEVHLSDENAGKEGVNDKRCMLEVRLDGKQPVAVTSNADSVEQAFKDSLIKMSALLTTAIGKMKSHN